MWRWTILLLGLASVTCVSCDKSAEPREDVVESGKLMPRIPTKIIPSERLNSAAIRAEFRGKVVAYSAPNMADDGIHEEYHTDGRWRGLHYSRGPGEFSGTWFVEGDQLCVSAKVGLESIDWDKGPVCRAVWRDDQTSVVLMEHVRHPGAPPVVMLPTSLAE